MQPKQTSSVKERILSSDWLNFERNEIFLLVSFFFIGAAFANYEPYAPFWLQQLFKVDSFLIIGLVVAIPSIAVAIGTSIWGYLADKFGIKRFVFLGISAYAILFFSLIFTTSSIYFLIAVLIGSLLGAAQTSNFYALGVKTIDKPKSLVFAKMIASISFSWVIMSPIVGWIYDLYPEEEKIISMRIQLGLAVIFCIVSLLFVSQIKTKPVQKADEPKEQNKKKPLTYLPILFSLVILTFIVWQITGGFWAFTSIYFLETLKIDGGIYSLYLILKTALAIPMSILLGRVKKHHTNTLLVLVFSIWTFVMYFFMMMFPLNWILFILIYSLPMYPLSIVTLYSIVSKFSSEERRATAFGIMNAAGTFGYVSGILILGFIADSSSMGIFSMLKASMIYGIGAIIMATVFYIFNRLRKDKLSSTEVL